MKKWEHILKYRPLFFVYTDASSLKYIVNLKSEETIFQHWYAELAQFEFIVIELRKLQESDEVWKEVLKWVSAGKTLKMQELRGSVQEVLSVRKIFNPMLFVIHNGVLSYNRHTDPTNPYDALHISVPAVKVKETFKICSEGVTAGHRGVAGTSDKFQRTFYIMSACDKTRRLVECCADVCLAKERSIKVKIGPQVTWVKNFLLI